MGNERSSRGNTKSSTKKQLSFDSGRMKDIGTRFTPEGSTSEYARDPDRLYALYKPLRMAIYKRVASKLYNEADKQDLISYINEHFVRLTKEYDVTNGVDFPGFIKTLLTFRANNSFISGLSRVYNKEEVVGIDEELEDKVRASGYGFVGKGADDEETVLAYYDDFIKFVGENFELSEIEWDILQGMVINERTLVLANTLREEYGLNQKQSIDAIKALRLKVLGFLKAYNNENN